MFEHNLKKMADKLIHAGLNGPSQRAEILAALREAWVDQVALVWTIADVRQEAEDCQLRLSDEECRQVLQYVLRHHDATRGVSWETFDEAYQALKLSNEAHYIPDEEDDDEQEGQKEKEEKGQEEASPTACEQPDEHVLDVPLSGAGDVQLDLGG